MAHQIASIYNDRVRVWRICGVNAAAARVASLLSSSPHAVVQLAKLSVDLQRDTSITYPDLSRDYVSARSR